MDYYMMKEKTPHGNSMFPLEVHELISDINFTERLNCHYHDEIEFLVVTNGEAEFYINERRYHVRKNDIIFVHPTFLHSASAINNQPFDFFAVVFSTSLLDSFINDSIQQNYLSPVYDNTIFLNEFLSSNINTEDSYNHASNLSTKNNFKDYIEKENENIFYENFGKGLENLYVKEIRSLLYKIRKLYKEQSICYELKIKAYLFEIWSLLFTNSKTSSTLIKKDNDYRIDRLKLVMAYIKENYSSKITLDDLSSITGLCTGQFCRFFKSMTRTSAVDYLNHYRIMQSIILIDTTTKSISEIAGLCGFNNISYFNKIFLKYMHVNPTEYRKSKS